jgi:Flp pilus assembly protein TadD
VLFIALSILAFGYRSVLRPEIFSYILLCIFLCLLEKDKYVYTLPFLQIIWVNLHGYFILGPTLIFLYTLGEFFFGKKHRARIFAIVFIGTILACFINPYFYRGALYPVIILFDVFTKQRLFMENIQELIMPIRSSFNRYAFFWLLAILASFTFIVNLKKAKLQHILIFALSFLASYMAGRNITIFILLAMAFSLINLNEAGLTKNISDRKYYFISICLILGLGYLFLSNKYYIFTNQFGLRKTESKFSSLLMPAEACDFLEKNKIEGKIFNTLDFGPYIGYRFYPEKRIFIDTRTDLYRDDFYMLYRRAQNYPEEWQRVCEKYRFEIALLRHLFTGTERILKYLHRHKDWRLVYYDKNSCIFLKNVSRNYDAIHRFEVDFKDKNLEPSDININIARFFEKIGEIDFAEKSFTKLLEKEPDFLEAGNNLAAIYIDTGRIDKGIELLQRFLKQYPHAPELYANMGIAYLRLGKEEEALAFLERAARLDPYYRKVSYILGIVYLERGALDRAMRQFIKYIRLDPYNAEVHRLLGDVYAQKGLSQKANLEYNEADALEGL